MRLICCMICRHSPPGLQPDIFNSQGLTPPNCNYSIEKRVSYVSYNEVAYEAYLYENVDLVA